MKLKIFLIIVVTSLFVAGSAWAGLCTHTDSGFSCLQRLCDEPTAYLVKESAAYADINTFFIYDPLNPDITLTVFLGLHDPGTSVTLTWSGGIVTNSLTGEFAAIPDIFGAGITSPEGIFYSQTALNADGFDHLRLIDYNGCPYYHCCDVRLEWEDIWGGGDQDFDDMVILMDNVTGTNCPVIPEPTTVLILSVIGAIGAAGKKFTRK